MRILLWDIDGTLIDTGGAGMRALARAVGASEAAGNALRRMRLGGMTDRKIARLLCAAERHVKDPETPIEEHQRRVTSDEIDHVLSTYLGALHESVKGSTGYAVLPGVRAALDATDGEAVHALATGNLEHGARLKLERGDLWRRFRFGGFGSDAEERPDILRAAWRKAEVQLDRQVSASEFVVIGDTPRDVLAAHEVGFACIAVASGGYSVHDLASHEPEGVLASLESPGATAMILSARRA